jgi:hypothetical protein
MDYPGGRPEDLAPFDWWWLVSGIFVVIVLEVFVDFLR